MRLTNKIDSKYLSNVFDEHAWIKYLAYGAGAVVGIWVLGKASKLITDAIINFKNLNNAIKQ